MKYIRLYLTSLVAAFMAACSSMEVDENELYSENFPKDFSDSVYMQLHPELRSIQIRNYVKARNTRLKDSLSADAYQTLYDADTTAFYGDTAKLHEIFVDPMCLNFTEDDWADVWMEIVSPDITCKQKYTFKEVFLDFGTDTTKVFVDSVKTDEGGNFTFIYGKKGDATAASQEFAIGETIKYVNQGAVLDSTEICDTTDVVIPGALTAIHKSLLADYNLIETTDDLVKAKKAPLDLTAIAYQYLMFGRIHGWTYRKCTKEEKGNPVRPILDAKETTDKYYCDDNGVAREIK